MTFNEYQIEAEKTATYPRSTTQDALTYLGLGLAGEAGEEGILSNRTLNSPVTGPISNWLLDYQQGRNPRFPETVSPAIPQTSGSLTTGNGSVSQSPQIVVQQTSNKELVDEIKRMNAFLSDPKNRQAYIPSDILKKHQEEDSLRTSISQTK